MRLPPALSSALALLAAAALPAHADPVKTDHMEAELVAENQSFSAGGDNWLALRVTPESGWHVYWRNPGDSGLATKLAWTLPPGVTAGDLQWPYPHRETLGDIVNYGYENQTLLPVQLKVPEEWPAGTPLAVAAKASWLVCKDICIPGSADLSLNLPVGAHDAPVQVDPHWRDAFAAARAQLPQPAPADWKVQFAVHEAASERDFSLAVAGTHFSAGGGIEFFPYAESLVNYAAPQRLDNDPGHGLRLSQKLNDNFVKAPAQVDGVLVVHDGEAVKAWEIHGQPGVVKAVQQGAAAAPAGAAAGSVSLGKALLLAVLGGLILNLMPCVFPVLSIKAISLIEARGKEARRARGHALAYTIGVLATFAILAGALLALRAGGAAVGWGFQLQQPAFVAALAYLLFAMALSLSGVVELGTRMMGVGQTLAASGGYRGSFFTGVLAVAVASPCTAPFMGTALGFSLGQPAPVALAVFLALGLGLALPFLLLGWFPRLGALLPRPGAWMQTFKNLMAFPLYLSVAWLLWVLGGLAGRDGMGLALVGLILVALALWLWNRPGALALVFKLAALAGAVALLALPQVRVPVAVAAVAGAPAADTRTWEPFSAQRLTELRGQGRTVFVDFTADWCLSCKFNERLVLDSEAVHAAFTAGNVALLRGDWTHSDPAITEVLQQYNHPGVPLYLVSVKGGEPKVLPQLLTTSLVLQALSPG